MADRPLQRVPESPRSRRWAESSFHVTPGYALHRRRECSELLDAIVVLVEHVEVPLGVGAYGGRKVELARAGAERTPLQDERPIRFVDLDAMIRRIGHDDEAIPLDARFLWATPLA